MGKEIRSILVVGPSWVGDMIMAQSLFKTLKEQHPRAEIDVLAPGWTNPILERMREVRDAIYMPVGHGQVQLKTRYKIGYDLRKKGYDWAIVLPNSLKAALIPYWARIPKRTGYIGEFRYGFLNDIRKLEKELLTMTVQRFVALAFPKGIAEVPDVRAPSIDVERKDGVNALSMLGILEPKKPVIVLCPGAEYGSAKRWPTEHFGAVAKQKIEDGYDVWIMGSHKEADLACEINLVCDGKAIDMCGKTELGQAFDIMSLADLVITNDSGLMHVAAALGCRLIAIYGSSTPSFTPPLSNKAKIMELNLRCRPCMKRECPEQHLKCLYDITPEMVLKEIMLN